MISVDSRENASLFLHYLSHGSYEITKLDFGDASFVGCGVDDTPVLVGIERKAIGDLLNSITSGRFSGHQLPGLLNSYSVVYLLVEGLYRAQPNTGLLEIRLGKDWTVVDRGRMWMYSDVEAWLTTIEEKAGVRIRRAPTPQDTAATIQGLHQWWCGKEYSEHRAHLTLHKPRDTALLRKASLVRVIAAELPGIGWSRSDAVSKVFKSVAEMVVASVEEWMCVEGIGKTTAEKVVKALYGWDMKQMKERRP